MRVFVAGATGAIGMRLVPRLVAAGHSVVGMTHRPEKVATIRLMGADAAVADGLEPEAVRAAVTKVRPEVIIHEMTDLKGASDLRKFDELFVASNCLRTEGTDHLLAAAKATGVKRFIAQSFCGWPYAPGGDPIKAETAPLDPDPPRELRCTLDAIRYLESAVLGFGEGLVLRYGAFYGPATGLFDGPMVDQLRHRKAPVIGDGNGWWSFIHIDDAAEATALAVTRGAPGIYNIVDDEPVPVRDWLPALAVLLGAKPPRTVPAWLARLAVGEHIVAMMTTNRAGSNSKAKQELGWQPVYRSWRQGFRDVIDNERLAMRWSSAGARRSPRR
jgi:nucleoside-diphosphate-sugar epimerase